MELFFKPLAHPAQCSAAQCVKHATNHDGKRNDQRQHPERIAAANFHRRYSLFNGDIGTALFAAACLGADPRFPIVDVM